MLTSSEYPGNVTITTITFPYQIEGSKEPLESFNDSQRGYLLIDVTPNSIEGSYIAVDDPQAGQPVRTKRPKPYDTFKATG